ncbi:MAG: hypothetical protein ACRCYV_08465 [Aeromonas sp.]
MVWIDVRPTIKRQGIGELAKVVLPSAVWRWGGGQSNDCFCFIPFTLSLSL